MVKKISFGIIAVAILVIGYIAFNKLNYWDRSVMIFNPNSTDLCFEGRMGRGQGGFEGRDGFRGREGFARPEGSGEGFERPQRREIPDSMRARFEAGSGRRGTRDGNTPDSLRRQFSQNDRNLNGRFSGEGAFRNGEGHGRGEFPGGKKIRLTNVMWFLAVFAAFTVVAIYIDKAYCLIRKRKQASF